MYNEPLGLVLKREDSNLDNSDNFDDGFSRKL